MGMNEYELQMYEIRELLKQGIEILREIREELRGRGGKDVTAMVTNSKQ